MVIKTLKHLRLLLTQLLLVLILTGASTFTSSASWRVPQASKLAAASSGNGGVDQKRFEELRRSGFEALYNLDYDGARAKFKELQQAFPDHPAGAQFLAAALWLRTLNDSRRLQTTLYNSESFYAETEEKTDPAIINQFREWTRSAKQLSEARLKLNPQDTEARYFLGAVEGLKAAFAGAVERRFVAALRDSSRAVDRHREVVKLDPTFHDAEITIGLHDYIIGGLPLPVKVLVGVTGVRGSKRRGIETLQRVAKEGRWAQNDAKVILIGILKREERFAEAAALARELAGKYDRNYLFKLELADALVLGVAAERRVAASKTPKDATQNSTTNTVSNAEREAFAIFEGLLQRDRAANGKNTGSRALDLIHFRYAEALMAAGQAEQAAKEFIAAATLPNAESGLATMSRLYAAQAFDYANRRNEALVQYQAVLARPNVYDAHDQARKGLREPYRSKSKPTSE